MKFAQVLVGLPLEGSFDYSIPYKLQEDIKIGSRVRIDFANRNLIGYVIGLTNESKIKKTKSILDLIDKSPILDDNLLKLTKVLSEYYCCFWSEMIETAIPLFLKKGKRIEIDNLNLKVVRKRKKQIPLLIYDQGGGEQWQIYYKKIDKNLKESKDIIFLLPEVQEVLKIGKILEEKYRNRLVYLYRTQTPKQSEVAWLRIRNSSGNIILGTRSAIFAPTQNLGIIILDKEESQSYKQDQNPFYHARVAASLRAELENAELILSSLSPSLESYYEVLQKKYKLGFFKKDIISEIKIIDMHQEFMNRRKKTLISTYLENEIRKNLQIDKKIIIFFNRQGFARNLRCKKCGFIIECPHCSSSLIYHYDKKKLICRFCNYKTNLIEICPQCNSSYIKYTGQGVEKLESQLHHLFPAAKITRIDQKLDKTPIDAQIVLSTKPISREEVDFKDRIGLVGVISLDAFLNRMDFRSIEKAFFVISHLLSLNPSSIVIQTYSQNYLLDILKKKDLKRFYTRELKERKMINFPPFSHFAIINLRDSQEGKVTQKALNLFEVFKKNIKSKNIELLSLQKANPYKLRGKYRYEILLKTTDPEELNNFLKKELQEFRHSGIIINVDVDPF